MASLRLALAPVAFVLLSMAMVPRASADPLASDVVAGSLPDAFDLPMVPSAPCISVPYPVDPSDPVHIDTRDCEKGIYDELQLIDDFAACANGPHPYMCPVPSRLPFVLCLPTGYCTPRDPLAPGDEWT